MKKTDLRINFLLCFFVFFFVGMTSINAQYVSSDEAVEILKGEVTELQAQLPNASFQEIIDITFQMHYYQFIVADLKDGAEVGAAIYDNQPAGKLKQVGTMGLAQAQNYDPTVKQEITALVNYVDALLSD